MFFNHGTVLAIIESYWLTGWERSEMSVWNVYIDETYLDNIQQARIITSFFAIDANESRRVIEKYQKKIIKKAKKEVKSLRASNNKETVK